METTNLFYTAVIAGCLMIFFIQIMLVRIYLTITRVHQENASRVVRYFDKHIEGASIEVPEYESYMVLIEEGDKIIPVLHCGNGVSMRFFGTRDEAQAYIDQLENVKGQTYHIQPIKLCI